MGLFSKYLENRPLFSKYLEKRPIHIFLIDTFQFFQITIIYKGTQGTTHRAGTGIHVCGILMVILRVGTAAERGEASIGTGRVQIQVQRDCMHCGLLISQDVGKMGFRQISLNIYILYQK